MMEAWKADVNIDETKISEELFRGHVLHSKYLAYYVFFKAKLAVAEKEYGKMTWVKRKYWRGEFEPHELQKYGWSQWQGLKPSSSELNQLLDADNDMNDLKEKVSMYKTAVSASEYILKQVQSREWTIKSFIEYNKYISGA